MASKPFHPTVGGPKALTAVLAAIKRDFERSVRAGGTLISVTRSQRPAHRLHHHLGDLLVQAGITPSWIDLERPLPTLFSQKRQDVTVVPGGRNKATGESTLSLGLKTQLYGVAKNIDNGLNAARGELLNLHETHHAMVAGHVQVVAVRGWDSDAADQGLIAFKRLTPASVATIIDRYSKINGRASGGRDGSAERIGLVLVDMQPRTPRVYTSVPALVRDGYLAQHSGLSLAGLTLNGCIPDLLDAHRRRFTGAHRLLPRITR